MIPYVLNLGFNENLNNYLKIYTNTDKIEIFIFFQKIPMDNCENNNEMLNNVPTVKENGVKKRQRRILIHSNSAANSKRNDLGGNVIFKCTNNNYYTIPQYTLPYNSFISIVTL